MKLISMTEFTELIDKDLIYSDTQGCKTALARIMNYANFLPQPLTLGMFVPCDEDGKALKEPSKCDCQGEIGMIDDPQCSMRCEFDDIYKRKYQQAKERVLFEGFEYINHHIKPWIIREDFKRYVYELESFNIEYLTKYSLTLTPTALKQIGEEEQNG